MLFRFEACEFYPAARRLLVGGVEHVIGGRAFDLLQALVENHDRVMGKDELYERVWPGLAVEPNNLQVQVWALRKVLGRHVIATVARRGYRFMPAVERLSAGTVAKALPGPAAPGAVAAGAASAMVAKLARTVADHPLVTLACPDAHAGDRLVQAAAQLMATRLAGRVWQVEAAALTGRWAEHLHRKGANAALNLATERLQALLLRVVRRPSVLVVLSGHLAEGLPEAVQHLLADSPRLRLMVSHQQALKQPGEKVLHWEADAAPPGAPANLKPHAPGAAALRWRSRTPTR